jgi:hypothetical protein
MAARAIIIIHHHHHNLNEAEEKAARAMMGYTRLPGARLSSCACLSAVLLQAIAAAEDPRTTQRLLSASLSPEHEHY